MRNYRRLLPECFGKLDTVFPKGEDGLRHSPEKCMTRCPYNTECLRTALSGNGGDTVREEKVDREYNAGAMSFLERWSRKKCLHRRKTADRKPS